MPLPNNPTARAVAWLLATRAGAPAAIRPQLLAGLYGSLPIFLGGVLNSIAIAAVAAWRHPAPPFVGWLMLEVALGLLRFPLVVRSRQALAAGIEPPAAPVALLSCAWAASVGFGGFISLTSGDWVLATIVCLSAAAMVCGICLRNFGTPRLAALMSMLMLAPCAIAGALTSAPVMVMISVQLPIYLATIFHGAFGLHGLMVSRMTALSDLEKSELFNRTILESSPDYTLILDPAHDIVFCNRPDAGFEAAASLVGLHWLDLLPEEDREGGRRLLAAAAHGQAGNFTTSHTDADGRRRWFDVIANQIRDGSGQIIVVARDITHQKHSEERALWMARHDPLTGLPNRAVLQGRLDAVLANEAHEAGCALLIVDVDRFKVINDTLGHDAGDAVLCAFAERLRASLGAGDLVSRTGGDEFAVLLPDCGEDGVRVAASRIFAGLQQPFVHAGQPIEFSASLGASLYPRDGANRSEIMKAADIALYAATAARHRSPAGSATPMHKRARLVSRSGRSPTKPRRGSPRRRPENSIPTPLGNEEDPTVGRDHRQGPRSGRRPAPPRSRSRSRTTSPAAARILPVYPPMACCAWALKGSIANDAVDVPATIPRSKGSRCWKRKAPAGRRFSIDVGAARRGPGATSGTRCHFRPQRAGRQAVAASRSG